MTFEDPSGELSGNFWDATDQDIATFEPGKVVLVRGKKELYQGKTKESRP